MELVIEAWVFAKPLLLAIGVYLLVQKRLSNRVWFLAASIMATYLAWYIVGAFLLPWVASAAVASNPPKNYAQMMIRLFSTQLLEVVVLTFTPYAISKLHWFRAKEKEESISRADVEGLDQKER